MITAIVLINADVRSLGKLGNELAAIQNIAEVYSVTGDYDFIAIIRVKEYDQVAQTVTGELAQLEGIINTNTRLAFQCFSRFDMERMWSIGQ